MCVRVYYATFFANDNEGNAVGVVNEKQWIEKRFPPKASFRKLPVNKMSALRDAR